MYADWWGDYWCYFSVFTRDTRTGEFLDGGGLMHALTRGEVPEWLTTNYVAAGQYLGRVNRVAILPTVIIGAALLLAVAGLFRTSRRPDLEHGHPRTIRAFFLLAIGTTLAGYGWFLVMYPHPFGEGDTIKATYLLQLVPFLALLTGLFLTRVESHSPRACRVLLVALALCFAHNLPAMLTAYR